MSHSVPSDSSAIDATFLVGVDLVEFDRRELPIYASPQTRWMDACYDDAPSYGAPVDRRKRVRIWRATTASATRSARS